MVEMLIVIVLLGILAMMAAPRLDLTAMQADSAMQRAGSALLAAQRIAVAEQHGVVVAVDEAGRRLRIHRDDNNDGKIDPGERVTWEDLGEGVVFGRATAPPHPQLGPPTVTFSARQGGLPALTFNRGGSASQWGGFYLTTMRAVRGGDRPTATRALIVERSTGRASWFSYTNDGWQRGF